MLFAIARVTGQQGTRVPKLRARKRPDFEWPTEATIALRMSSPVSDNRRR